MHEAAETSTSGNEKLETTEKDARAPVEDWFVDDEIGSATAVAHDTVESAADIPQMEPIRAGRARPRKQSLAAFVKSNGPCSSACCGRGVEKDDVGKPAASTCLSTAMCPARLRSLAVLIEKGQ